MHPVDAQWTGDVLDLLLAQILKRERQLVTDLLVDRIGDEHTSRLCQGFEPGRYIDAVTIDPGLVVNHVTQIDADAEPHTAMLGYCLVARRHDALELDCAFGRTDNTRKLGQNTVAGRVDDATAIVANQRQDHSLMALEVANRRVLVFTHESAVAGDIGGKNGGKPTLSREFFVHHLLSGAAVDVGDSASGIVAHRAPDRKEHSPFKPCL